MCFNNQVFLFKKMTSLAKPAAIVRHFTALDPLIYVFIYFCVSLAGVQEFNKSVTECTTAQPINQPSGGEGGGRGRGVECTKDTSGYLHAAMLWTLAATATPPPADATPNLMSNTKGMNLYHHKTRVCYCNMYFIKKKQQIVFSLWTVAVSEVYNLASLYWKLDFCFLT